MKVWIGDPCYAFDAVISEEHDDWIDLLEKTDYFENNDAIIFKDRWISAHTTAYGDGLYDGSDGNEYGVDSGTIGFIEWKEGDTEVNGAFLHEFQTKPSVSYDDGVIIISDGRKSVSIDTDPEPVFDEEIYDEENDGWD